MACNVTSANRGCIAVCGTATGTQAELRIPNESVLSMKFLEGGKCEEDRPNKPPPSQLSPPSLSCKCMAVRNFRPCRRNDDDAKGRATQLREDEPKSVFELIEFAVQTGNERERAWDG